MVSIPVDDSLTMRSYSLYDAPELFRCVNDSRQHLRPYLNWVDRTTRVEHSEQFIEHTLLQIEHQQGMALGIFRDAREIIGGIGMHQWDHYLKRAQIGYWLAKEHEGAGYMTRCAARFIDYLLAQTDLGKIEIHFLQQNKRSAALAARLGAKVEGVIREGYRLNGGLEDVVITGILKREWMVREG